MSRYDKPQPYDKPRSYDGIETGPPITAPSQRAAVVMPYGQATSQYTESSFPWVQATPHAAPTSASWGGLSSMARSIVLAWQQAKHRQRGVRMSWDALARHAAAVVARWSQATPHWLRTAMRWQDFARHLAHDVRLPWRQATPHSARTVASWGELGAHAAQYSMLWRALRARNAYIAIPWGEGHHYRVGYTIPSTSVPETTPLTVPILPVYIMIPDITAVVAGTGADLKPLQITVSGDVKSTDWAIEMQIPEEVFGLINPDTRADPEIVYCTINGHPWSFAVIDYTNNEKYNLKGYTVSGRSRSVLLGPDYGLKRTLLEEDDFTAAQLAERELTGTGWTLLWDAPDWLVPGGTFTYTDLTPLAAIQQLAAAIGATVETDPSLLTLRVRPEYPVKPWAWDDETPYAILPASILDGKQGRAGGGTNANGVHVYARNESAGAFVRITGTGGTNYLGQVVDALTVDATSQEARGIQELAKVGKAKQFTLDYPLFPAPASPGVIPLRSLLTVYDDHGVPCKVQVMANRISASRGGGVTVRQSVTVERQFRDAP